MTPPVRGLSLAPGLPFRLLSDRRTLSNPARGVSLPRKVKKPHIYLSHEQVRALAAASKYPGLVLVLAYCGIRWGEATALRVKHLDMLRRRLNVRNSETRRPPRRFAWPCPSRAARPCHDTGGTTRSVFERLPRRPDRPRQRLAQPA